MRGSAILGVLAEEVVKLLALDVRGVLDGERTTLRDDVEGGIGTSDSCKARALTPEIRSRASSEI